MVITLRRGALTAQADTLGGELVSLRREGTEYIWSGDPAYWSGRNPLLFPIVGALKNGVVDIGGPSVSGRTIPPWSSIPSPLTCGSATA